MAEVTLNIDGGEVIAQEGATILTVANSLGIDIPTLCYHPLLKPYGGCRLCIVEIIEKGRSRIVTSCNYPVNNGLEIKTASERVIADRKVLIELLLARCPGSEDIKKLAQQYGIEKSRFKTGAPEELCILCGLCVRMCDEVVGASAINFIERGINKEVAVLPEITAEVCIGCGACTTVCPTGLITMEDLYGRKVLHSEASLGPTTAIHVPFRQAVPNAPVIDADACIHFKTGACQVCQRLCEQQAVNHDMEEEFEEIEVGNIIITTGFQQFDPSVIWQYGYGRYNNVITGLEFEQMINSSGPTEGHVLLADGREPETIAIIHCVGSRDEKYHEYCSRVCCMHSMKFAHLIKEHSEAHVYEFYIDIRSFGKGYEEFYNRMLDEGTIFIRSRPAEITDLAETPEEVGKLIVQFEDTLAGIQRRLPFDMVILSCALEPRADADAVARLFNISRSADGFFLERHPKLDPVATMSDGIFIAGCCQGPKDIPDTVAQAAAAATEALVLINKGVVEVEAATAVINERICSGCQICKILCPYNAITYDEEKAVCRVNEALCKGCGACTSGCYSNAVSLNHYTNEQIVAQMQGMLSQ